MLPIRLLSKTDPFTPKCFLRIVERDSELLLADHQCDIPNSEVFGIHFDVEFSGTTVLSHFKCAFDNEYYVGVDPTIGLDISDLREACNVKPIDTYKHIVLQQARWLSGLHRPECAPPHCIIQSLDELKRRIKRTW